MALAGITAVGEFHYLHHGPGGAALRRPERHGGRPDRGRGARPGSGSRCSTRATCAGGIGSRAQRRAAAVLRRERRRLGRAGRGARGRTDRAGGRRDPQCPSRRARGAAAVAAWAAERSRPLHAHVSEQPDENEACMEAYGVTPAAVLDSAGALVCALHRGARHPPRPTPTSSCSGRTGWLLPLSHHRARPRRRRRARPPHDRGRRTAVARHRLPRGDRHVRGGARGRARRAPGDRARGLHRAADLLRAATENGHASLGWPEAGRIAARRARRPRHGGPRQRAARGNRAGARGRVARLRGRRLGRAPRDGRGPVRGAATALTSSLDVAGDLRAALAAAR